MDDKDRFRRNEPLRDRPIRDAAEHLRGGDQLHPPLETHGLDQVVTDAVGLGYDVIDTYIRQGRFAAEQARTGIDASGVKGDVVELAERAITLSIDLAKSWLDLVTAISEQCRRPSPSPHTPDEPLQPADYEIISSRPTQVEFQFHPGAGQMIPAIPSLQARDRTIPPITGAFFTVSKDGKRPALNIPVPEGQPAGTYSGLIVDATTHRPGGTVLVRILS
jgi:hypothetical protein